MHKVISILVLSNKVLLPETTYPEQRRKPVDTRIKSVGLWAYFRP